MKKTKNNQQKEFTIGDFLPYLADLGLVGFIASLVLVVVGVALEIVYPGLVFNHIAPQRLILALVIFGLLALLSPQQKKSWLRTIFFAVVSLVVAVFMTLFAWNYFASLADRLLLTAVTALATVIILVGALRATTDPELQSPES